MFVNIGFLICGFGAYSTEDFVLDELVQYKHKVEEKDKKLKELVDLSSVQASKQSESVKRLADENKLLKAEIAALKKQLSVPREASMIDDDDEASSSCGGGAEKKYRKGAGRPRKETGIKK